MTDNRISPENIPILCEGIDFATLDVDAREGFVISRIDGRSSVEHIISISGLGREDTIKILAALMDKGIICMHNAAGNKPPETARTAGSKETRKPDDVKPKMDTIPEGPAFRLWIEQIFKELDNINYFELLGVDRAATPREIKKAYLKRSKVFHPDRFYRKAEPEFRDQLKEIFKQVNIAFKVLSDEDRRKEYENLTKAKGKGIKISTITAKAKLDEADWKKKRPDLPKLSLDFSKDKKKKQEEKILNKLREGPFLEQMQKAQRFYEGAKIEIQKKNIKAARTNIKLAMQYDPMNPKYKEEFEKLNATEERLKGEIAFEDGLAAENDKDYIKALRFFQEAAKIDSQNPEYLYKLAEAVLKYQENFEKARTLCLKAIELAGGNPRYHLVLGLAYKGLGQMLPAAIQFEKVLELDPKNKQAAKELKAVRKS